jgi:integrase
MDLLAIESIPDRSVSEDMETIPDNSFNEINSLETDEINTNGNLKRFHIPTDQELNDVMSYSKVINTELSTQTWYKLFKQFRQEASFDGGIKDIANEKQLELELCKFFVGVRKKDGDFYKPRSLYVGFCAIVRGLKQDIPNLTENLFDKNKFPKLWQTLSGKIKQIQDTNNVRRTKSDALEKHEILHILEHPSLNLNEPLSLTKKVAFWLSYLCSFRGGDLKRLQDSWVILNNDKSVTVSLPREKNHAGGLDDMDNNGRVCEIPADTNNKFRPVQDITYYKSRRPAHCKCSMFFLKIENKVNIEKGKWFSDTNLGKNTLDNLIKQICKDCDIDIGKRHIVNHSMRTTSIMQLTNLGVPVNEIMAYSGHRSLAGLSSYQTIPRKQMLSNVSSLIYSESSSPEISEAGTKAVVESCNEDDGCVLLSGKNFFGVI